MQKMRAFTLLAFGSTVFALGTVSVLAASHSFPTVQPTTLPTTRDGLYPIFPFLFVLVALLSLFISLSLTFIDTQKKKMHRKYHVITAIELFFVVAAVVALLYPFTPRTFRVSLSDLIVAAALTIPVGILQIYKLLHFRKYAQYKNELYALDVFVLIFAIAPSLFVAGYLFF